MTKYEKFIFQELPKNSVVNSHDNQEIDYQDELINQVITQHLQTIVPGATEEEDTALDADEEIEIDEDVSIDEIKNASYNQGLDDAKASYEKVISELQTDNNLAELLRDKLAEITSDINLDLQIAKVTSQIISNIAKKIYLILPVDFEQILKSELLQSLKKVYKEGQISLTVNPSKYDFCKNILQVESLPAKLKENIHVIEDDSMDADDCKLEWENTSLEYNKQQISEEIEKILGQIKTIA